MRSIRRVVSLSALLVAAASSGAIAQDQLMLHTAWLIQSSAKVGTDGAAISTTSYHPADWNSATVPSTVVGALVENGTYKDPFFGMNLRDLPGTTFKIGANFVHTAMVRLPTGAGEKGLTAFVV